MNGRAEPRTPVWEFEITYQVRRRRAGTDRWREVGFGASSARSTPEEAVFEASSALERREWETLPSMPRAEDVDL